MSKVICVVALLLCVVAIPSATATAEAPVSVRGVYRFNTVGVFRFQGDRQVVLDGGVLEIFRRRIVGSTDGRAGSVIAFNLRLNRPINDRRTRQRRTATGSFTSTRGGRVTRGTGRITATLTKLDNGRVRLRGTYNIEWTSGQFAGGRSRGLASGRKR